MEKQLAFHILELEETKDERRIQDAYRTLLRKTNPEDDPEGFKRLRTAYETALAWARQPEEAAEEEKTEVQLWIDRVDKVYRDIHDRCQPDAWNEVLEDPICDDLDTSLQAREAMMAYLMDHIYLPNRIWKILDAKFQIVEDRELLEQQFPADFLNYVTYYIQNQEFINYRLFEVLDEENNDADAYIRNYLGIKRSIDQGQLGTEEVNDCKKRLNDLRAFGIYHPYEEVEELRLLAALLSRAQEADAGDVKPEDTPGGKAAVSLLEHLLEDYGADSYVLLHCGAVLWDLGQDEKAADQWRKILEEFPTHYMAKFYMARYLMKQKEYKKAKEGLLELVDMDENDQMVIQMLHEVNDALVPVYQEQLAREGSEGENHFNDTMELVRCYYQNEHVDEAIALMRELVPDEDQEYDYENLMGRVYYRGGQYEEAFPHLKHWLELIRQTPDDKTEENEKRRSREFRACHILSGCCHEKGDKEGALDYVDQAVRAAQNPEDRISAMQYKAYILFCNKEYERCIDACDLVIQENDGYFPAYLQRQEAAFELKKGQQVVDDYYKAINIYSGYYKPYLLAAQVFFYHDQYEDAKGVLDRAKENQVEFSDNMKLFEVKILRNLAKSREDRDEPFDIAEGLLEAVKNPETDIEDTSEVEYEISLLYWDNNDLDDALTHLATAIGQNPDRMQYRMIRGHIYLDKKEYKKALEEYDAAQKDYSEAPALYYNRGLCQEGLGEEEEALNCFLKCLELKEGYRDACEKVADYYKDRYTSHYDPADFDLALSYMNRQLAARENCYYLVERGRLYMSAFKLDEAIRDFEKALEYVSDDWASYNNMGCCYKYMGQFEKGIECLQKAVECMKEDKSVLPYSNMADCYEALGQYEKAIECYLKDLEMFPDRKVFHKEIGLLYQAMGDYENALKYYEMEPGLDDYYDNVASIYHLQGNIKLAVKTYEKGIYKAADEDKADRIGDLAYYYKEILHDYKKAKLYYKKALAAAKNDGQRRELEWKLASLYFMLGEKDNAKFHARKTLDYFAKSDDGTEENYLNYPTYRPARLMRFGWVYICLGETEKGLEMFRQMTRCLRCRQCSHDGCFESYLYLGRYYETVGDKKKALEYIEKAYEIDHGDLAILAALKRLRGTL